MTSANHEEREFEALLDFLKRNRGFDFSAYKRPSLMRRVRRRMQNVGIEKFTDYSDFLEVHPEEFGHLFDNILINVTSFFRDPQSWETLATDVIPKVVDNKKPDEPIRIWCAGVASGEEVYTLAMLVSEAVGEQGFQERVKIYATDLDDDALNQARLAIFSDKAMEPVPTELRDKYFERSNGRFTFRKDLRRSIIFGRHDLIQDAPISRVDLLVCRNTLMYFNAEAQGRILLHFHFALNDDGVLFLGKSEMLLTHTNVFTPLDLKRRIFVKVPKVGLREQLLVMGNPNHDAPDQIALNVRLRDSAFDTSVVPQLVVDTDGCLTMANQQARAMFGIHARDITRPLKDLEVSYRPVELRSRIEQAFAEQRLITMKEVQWDIAENEKRFLDVQIMPLSSTNGNPVGASIVFNDITRYKELEEEVRVSKQELATAYEEVQSTNEELETTNEELQSTNEELETLNEELQSTNEELETMNEELQSTNEELETTNEEMRGRTEALNLSNDFLESVLTSVRVGVMVVDRNFRVQSWNHKSEDLWGLRTAEVQGQNFLNLDIGLRVDQLKQAVRDCLSGDQEFQEVRLEAINRRGKQIECRITCTPLVSSSDGIRGAILLVEDKDPHG
ncbi:MAG TPA: CheR family methyltransferase [Blastocatellia bacterium]|nr:CheR family methyltransferase [Blastocatellia bacterium]